MMREFDEVVVIPDADEIQPQVTWGTLRRWWWRSATASRTRRASRCGESRRHATERAARLHGAGRRHADRDIAVDKVSSARAPIRGSRTCACRGGRRQGRQGRGNVKQALVVPGSGLVKAQAETRGWIDLHRRRLRMARAGLLDVPGDECRPAGTRRTLRIDLEPQFRGAPGKADAPIWSVLAMAAAAAIAGHFADIRDLRFDRDDEQAVPGAAALVLPAWRRLRGWARIFQRRRGKIEDAVR